MKAVKYYKYGGPENLTLEDIPVPEPKPGEVLVKVEAVSVNSWDWDMLRGKPFFTRMWGLFEPKANILGSDVAGTVVSKGKNVENLKPGDKIFGDLSGKKWGGFAEYVSASENKLAKIPDGISMTEAAAIPQAGLLALQGLRGRVNPGDKVLINGAGGGTGTFAIQIAVHYGAEVTGVDRGEKAETMLSAGAIYTIDYEREDFTNNGKKYDLIYDVWGTHPIKDYRRALVQGGEYIMAGGSVNTILKVMVLGPLLTRLSNKKIGMLGHRPDKKDLEDMCRLYFEAGIKPVIDKEFPLEETAEALKYLGEGKTKGKVVVVV